MARLTLTTDALKVRDGEECAQPSRAYDEADNTGWVCLGKFRTSYEKLVHEHEMMISKIAFKTDVLLNLVLFSLQVQSEAELESKAQIKTAETYAEAVTQANFKAKRKIEARSPDASGHQR
jgi:hypothetical protein